MKSWEKSWGRHWIIGLLAPSPIALAKVVFGAKMGNIELTGKNCRTKNYSRLQEAQSFFVTV